MRRHRLHFISGWILAGLALAAPGRAFGWSHQGHILITRLAALRIISDPAAPEGLRDFLSLEMKSTLEECGELALHQTVGSNPQENPQFEAGLDKWCTMPDVIISTPEGKAPLEPYGAPEALMHYVDMELFSPEAVYKDDLSNKPKLSEFPHDLSDPRWKRAGFVPWRVEEMCRKLTSAMGSGATIADPGGALQAAGYLAHYVEDSTQPHHATIDYKSLSYLVGRLKDLPAAAQAAPAVAPLHAPRGVNPHGDLEFQLFEDDKAPRDRFRRQYWDDLLRDVELLAAERATAPATQSPAFDPFVWDLTILSDSYDNLPFIGRAAQAAYATGEFDPAAFFDFRADNRGEVMTTVELIARQNAKAVLDVEEAYRKAWDIAHPSAAVATH